jgi:hypothetical protein
MLEPRFDQQAEHANPYDCTHVTDTNVSVERGGVTDIADSQTLVQHEGHTRYVARGVHQKPAIALQDIKPYFSKSQHVDHL